MGPGLQELPVFQEKMEIQIFVIYLNVEMLVKFKKNTLGRPKKTLLAYKYPIFPSQTPRSSQASWVLGAVNFLNGKGYMYV